MVKLATQVPSPFSVKVNVNETKKTTHSALMQSYVYMCDLISHNSVQTVTGERDS